MDDDFDQLYDHVEEVSQETIDNIVVEYVSKSTELLEKILVKIIENENERVGKLAHAISNDQLNNLEFIGNKLFETVKQHSSDMEPTLELIGDFAAVFGITSILKLVKNNEVSTD